MFVPDPDLLEPGFHYSEPFHSGCTNRPEWTQPANSSGFLSHLAGDLRTLVSDAPAAKYNVDGWNGFCQIGFSTCPDAKANKDYSYYAKALGPTWIKLMSSVDSLYCGMSGMLAPEIASIVHNFTALQAKGEEWCSTKYADTAETMSLSGIQDAMLTGLKDTLNGSKSIPTVINEMLTGSGSLVMDTKAANMAAAWNCALGDLACDMAYCNYAYCDLGNGRYGAMEECEGWDKVKGMPATWA